jgi:hypothetical protein
MNNVMPVKKRCSRCGRILTTALLICSACMTAHAEPHPEPVPLSPQIVQPIVTQTSTTADWNFSRYKILIKK